jgi:hypothetical protein
MQGGVKEVALLVSEGHDFLILMAFIRQVDY